MITKLPNQVIYRNLVYDLYINYSNKGSSAEPYFEWNIQYYQGSSALVSMKGTKYSEIEYSMLNYLKNNKIESV